MPEPQPGPPPGRPKRGAAAEGAAGERLSYGIGEFARLTGMSLPTIYRRLRAGELRAVRSKRRTLILREDAEKFLRGLPALGGSEP